MGKSRGDGSRKPAREGPVVSAAAATGDAGDAPRTPLSKRVVRDLISMRMQWKRLATALIALAALSYMAWAAFVFEVEMNSKVDRSISPDSLALNAGAGGAEAAVLELSLAQLADASVPQLRADLAADLGIDSNATPPPPPPSAARVMPAFANSTDEVYVPLNDGIPLRRTSDYPGLNITRKKLLQFYSHAQLLKHRHHGALVEIGKLDMLLLDWYFGYPKVLRDGVFVEFGAMDGYHDSITRLFEEALGWGGLLVEPVPRNIEKFALQTPRNRSVLAQTAVCYKHEGGSVEMVGEGGSAAVRIYVEKGYEAVHRKFWKPPFDQSFNVSCAPASEILQQNFEVLRNGNIDLLTIHVSSSEPVVLNTIDFARMRPKVVVLRQYVTCRGEDGSDICRKQLLRAGYCKDLMIAAVSFFVHNSTNLGRFGCKNSASSGP